jgi:hypothetical protein
MNTIRATEVAAFIPEPLLIGDPQCGHAVAFDCDGEHAVQGAVVAVHG